MQTNQYAIYRVDPNKKGRKLKHLPYQEVRRKKLPVRMDYYKQIHLGIMEPEEKVRDIWQKTKVITEVSDVLVVNKEGELSCFYIDEETPCRITGFIQLNPTGTIITIDTKDHEIAGMAGKWMVTDTLIVEGKQYYLMEHHKHGKNAAGVILDSYGRLITESVNGFDQKTKDFILQEKTQMQKSLMEQMDYTKKQNMQNAKTRLEAIYNQQKKAKEHERNLESGTEASYSMVDGCVNNLKTDEISSASHRGQAEKKPKKKRTSVIRKLHEKQVAIAQRTGRPVPRYLQQEICAERARK